MMKDELIIGGLDSLIALNPTEKDENTYARVVCIDKLHHLQRRQWVQSLMKLCYICAKELVLEVIVDDSRDWGFTYRGRISLPTACYVEFYLNHGTFVIREEKELDDKKVRYKAEKMPRMEWNEGAYDLHLYPNNSVVKVPLSHPFFEYYFDFLENVTKERFMRREEEERMIENFKVWYFVPTVYCLNCRKLHDGKHRLMVAKQKGIGYVWLRIQDTPQRYDGQCAKANAWADRSPKNWDKKRTKPIPNSDGSCK